MRTFSDFETLSLTPSNSQTRMRHAKNISYFPLAGNRPDSGIERISDGQISEST
jgi:hypothetical protein